MKWSTFVLVGLITWLVATPARADTPTAPKKPAWKKIVLDRKLRSEGVAVADVNKDGKRDILAGDVWYEAPTWKMHEIRKVGQYNPLGYSNSFACFADDLNGDGWTDVIIIGFPGTPCHWYENPQNKEGHWKEHEITTSACNESPQYIDLFGKGQRVLVMGWQPDNKKDNMGQMCWFRPGKDPTQPWERLPISEPSTTAKEIPGTKRYSHGLGFGDINGDGRRDVLCTAGWWEQPAQVSDQPWKFHPGNLGEACADMRVLDLDGDGKVDVISTSAHGYGMWWHQQRPGKGDSPGFVKQDLFPQPHLWSALPKGLPLSQEEVELFGLINKFRNDLRKAPFKLDPVLCQVAQEHSRQAAQMGAMQAQLVREGVNKAGFKGKINMTGYLGRKLSSTELARTVCISHEYAKGTLEEKKLLDGFWNEIGIGVVQNGEGDRQFMTIILGKRGGFYIPSQTHALHLVDMNGDGIPDIVTGRRWWAHGPKGDPGSGDPAYLYWFEAKRNKEGAVTFTPHLIDDDSGVGTQFEVIDVNGDGIPDIVISNKKGVFVLLQERSAARQTGARE